YIQEHPDQQEAVSVLVAVAQGPKGLVQLAVFNAVSETPLGQNIGQRLAEYGEVLGEQVANAMEGEKINKDDNTGAYLIGGGVLTAGILTGMLVSGKSVAKSRTISAEMKADAYHPDWKNYTGTDRGVGADVVKGGGAKGVEIPPSVNKPLGLGSTGRTTPANLNEQIAMEQAISNPAAGRSLPVPMTDSRWPATDGWVKTAQNINGIEIHYVRNSITGAIDDFKFK
ncbi:hypothetical protein, partial [Pseudomonas syringae]